MKTFSLTVTNQGESHTGRRIGLTPYVVIQRTIESGHPHCSATNFTIVAALLGTPRTFRPMSFNHVYHARFLYLRSIGKTDKRIQSTIEAYPSLPKNRLVVRLVSHASPFPMENLCCVILVMHLSSNEWIN